MLSIGMVDIMNVADQTSRFLINIGVVLAVAVGFSLIALLVPKPFKQLLCGQTWIAALLAVLVMTNLFCTGPLATLLSLRAGGRAGRISSDTAQEAVELTNRICAEGITLLKNEEEILPLARKRVNVFGWSAINPCYGGAGADLLNREYPTVSFLQGLTDAGIEYNADLIRFYTDYHPANLPNVGEWAQNWTLPQPIASDYPADLMKSARTYSDTAIIFISRVSGADVDLPVDLFALAAAGREGQAGAVYDDTVNRGRDWDEGDHYLQLTNPEQEMIGMVCANFERVILICNTAAPFELGFVNDHPAIKGALWCAGAGQSGFDALGEVLTGALNPSGRLPDTFVYDLTAAPSFHNFGSFQYDNVDEFTVFSANLPGDYTAVRPTFVNYAEGIYVGYKFYETAAKEELIDYDSVVQYPFGYGLSYTTFEQEIAGFVCSGTDVSMEVRVTNTGPVAGKSVVQIYYEPPYQNGGIEKASANLLDFAKTGVLAPGETEIISFSFTAEEMACYDYRGLGCYMLEKGYYTVSINTDSHHVLDTRIIMVPMTINYSRDVTRGGDRQTAVNRFDYAAGNVTYLSRADGFANYEQAVSAPADFSMSAGVKSGFRNNAGYLTERMTAQDEDANAEYPIFASAATRYKLLKMRDLAYDDPLWEDLLDQLTLEEMNGLTSLGGYQTAAIPSIGKYATTECGGPGALKNDFTGQGSAAFPDGVMLAATWNKKLAQEFGEAVGKMADEMDVSGWYGPALNIHRSAFGGRNFESYSEDGVLSGYMAARTILGVQTQGVYACMKRFALNEQQTNRCAMLCTWCNEQALREIYLKPFEMAVKKGGALAAMSSVNYIGTRWAGGTRELQTDVLRGEWGFEGFVVSDYFGVYGYMNADQGIRSGTDLCMVDYATSANDMQFTQTAGAQQALRQAVHRILYVTVNSRRYSEANLRKAARPVLWKTVLILADICVGALLLFWEFVLIRNFARRWRELAAARAAELARRREQEEREQLGFNGQGLWHETYGDNYQGESIYQWYGYGGQYGPEHSGPGR